MRNPSPKSLQTSELAAAAAAHGEVLEIPASGGYTPSTALKGGGAPCDDPGAGSTPAFLLPGICREK